MVGAGVTKRNRVRSLPSSQEDSTQPTLIQVSGDLRKASVLRARWGDCLSWFVPVLPLKVLSKLGPDYCRAQVGGVRSGSYGSVGEKKRKKLCD